MPARSFWSFPDPVDEVSARLVAAGVVALSGSYLVTRWQPLVLLLALGFVARVTTGPRLSPLGRLVTQVIRPALPLAPRPTPGPPKRFAQGIGAALSVGALGAVLGGAPSLAFALVAAITAAASLEAAVGFCLGCRIFALLMRAGLIPARVCEACADISRRRPAAA